MRLSALTCAALLAVACQKTVIIGSGVVVVVLTDPQVKADCIGVAVVKKSGGTEQLSTLAKREDHLEFAVGSGPGLDGEISVVARGFLGANCSTPGVLNAQSAPGSITFQEGSASPKLTLELTGALDDDDGDGYRAHDKGGTDCDPSNAAINPGEVELCSDGIDNDCSGLADCADRASCAGHACNDGNACSMGETCVNAVCTPPQAPCRSPPNDCYAMVGACSVAGSCTYAVATGSPCDGGTCRSDGVCAAGETICDDGVDNDLNGSTDCADPACLNQQCNDGDPCTTPDRCGAVSCAGPPLICNTPPASACIVQDAGVCVAGDCQYLARTGASCDDGQPCTVTDSCNADGGCAGQPKKCAAANDGGCSAALGTCNPADGTCQFATAPAGTTCDDRNGCTAMDLCSDAGACQGTAITCAASACQVPVGCMGGTCMFTNADAGTACDAGVCAAGVCSAFSYVPSNFSPTLIAASDWSGTVHLTGACIVAFSSNGAGAFTNTCGLTNLPAPKQVSLSDGNLALLLPFGALTIDAPSTLALTGDKPVILAVKGDATVTGLLSASSAGGTLGAGANAAACSALPPGPGVTVTIPGGAMGSGGGGGAFATAGTAGGHTSDGGSPTAGAGGMPNGGAALVPLRGGCPGAVGGQNGNGLVCLSGSGGGAVQLSVAGTLTVNGRVAASGAGGPAGPSASANPNTGGGGGCGAGSGGGILLEARAVNLNGGTLLTNGGGGGEGGALANLGNDGTSGSTTAATAAPGGDLGNTNGGKGGSGAAGRVGMGSFVPAGLAVDGLNQGGGGGGGGGVGRVRVNAVQSCAAPGTVSGDITFNMSCP